MVTVPLLLENMYQKIWKNVKKNKPMEIKLKVALFYTDLLNKVFKIDIRQKTFKSITDNFGGRLRLIITGAAAVNPKVSKFFRKIGILVLQGYGLTECAPLVTGNRDKNFKDNAAGLPIPGVQLKIMNPNRNGIGEIAVKGDNVMLGYYKNDIATKKCFSDGWFLTGDLGHVVRNGFLHITGRLKNVIITKNGENVYPEEIETHINNSPFVQESLVYGVYDHKSGKTFICAQIFPNIDAIREKLEILNISTKELMKALNDVVNNVNKEMPLYKHIHQFIIREKEFAKTTTKKIKRYIDPPTDHAFL